MPKPLKETTAPAKARSSPTKIAPETRELVDAAAPYAGAFRAEDTKRADTLHQRLHTFTTWCEPQQFAPMPALPGTVAPYLTALAISDRKMATIERALVAICQGAQAARLPLYLAR